MVDPSGKDELTAAAQEESGAMMQTALQLSQ